MCMLLSKLCLPYLVQLIIIGLIVDIHSLCVGFPSFLYYKVIT